MENKQVYFTPSIEDMRVGYECEYVNNGIWMRCWVGSGSQEVTISDAILFTEIIPEHIRTPYLTKEQIEAEGWKLLNDWTKTGNVIELVYIKNSYWKMYFIHGVSDNCHFFGSNTGQFKSFPDIQACLPSINEFRTFIKLLGI